MTLFLQRIGIRCQTDNVNLVCRDFPLLTCALGWDQFSADNYRGTGGQSFYVAIIRQGFIGDDLYVFETGTVVDFKK